MRLGVKTKTVIDDVVRMAGIEGVLLCRGEHVIRGRDDIGQGDAGRVEMDSGKRGDLSHQFSLSRSLHHNLCVRIPHDGPQHNRHRPVARAGASKLGVFHLS